MIVLKHKTSDGWETVRDTFPVDVPIEIEQINANLGELIVTENGNYSASPMYDAFSKIKVDVSVLPSPIVAGDTPILMSKETKRATSSSSLQASGIIIEIPRDGTYRLKWTVGEATSSRYSVTTRLYVNGSPAGTDHVAETAEAYYEDLTLEADDNVEVWIKGYSDYGTYGSVCGLYACIDWDIWG